MNLIETLSHKWKGVDYPFLIHQDSKLKFSDIIVQKLNNLTEIKSGNVVALIGGFDSITIHTFLNLIEIGAIIIPLTKDTKIQHDYFFNSAFVDFVIEGNRVTKRKIKNTHKLIKKLKQQKHAGLVLFSTGTTGQPKAILHDLTLFLKRFETPRPTLRTINFLLFDHIGGLNTFFHTLFNKGVVVVPKSHAVDSILKTCVDHKVDLLPTTPTFLRMMLMSGSVPSKVPQCLKIITYGTERMDQLTLETLCKLLPDIDFRQTYGTSELGIVRAKSKARNSLYIKIGGEGIETRVANNILQIRTKTPMLGYLNAHSPFDAEGWYNTKDVVEQKDGFYKIVGRNTEIINVGGLKFMASEVEKVVINYPDVALVKVTPRNNPITGQHVEITVQPKQDKVIDLNDIKSYLKNHLLNHMIPKKIVINEVLVGHRFKRQ